MLLLHVVLELEQAGVLLESQRLALLVQATLLLLDFALGLLDLNELGVLLLLELVELVGLLLLVRVERALGFLQGLPLLHIV